MIHTIDLKFQGIDHAIAAFLIETSVGPVLVETGPYSTFPHLKAGIESAGFSLNDINHVFISHIHFDHAGASWAFAESGANIYLHPVGKVHMADPSRLVMSAKRIYGDAMDTLWGPLNPIHPDQLITVEDGQEIQIGDQVFKSHHTPGHAIHHIAWQLGKVLFTGDVAGVRIDSGKIVPPCPPPDINIEHWMDSIALIKNLDLNALYLTHYGRIESINAHLDELIEILKDWSEWMRPYALEDRPDKEEITRKFQNYVAQQLRDEGITEEGIEQYEAANPSWMSVAGLIRYWKKRTKTA